MVEKKYITWVKGECQLDKEKDYWKAELEMSDRFMDMLGKIMVSQPPSKCPAYLYCEMENRKRNLVRRCVSSQLPRGSFDANLGTFFDKEWVDAGEKKRTFYFSSISNFTQFADLLQNFIHVVVQSSVELNKKYNIDIRTEVEEDEGE